MHYKLEKLQPRYHKLYLLHIISIIITTVHYKWLLILFNSHIEALISLSNMLERHCTVQQNTERQTYIHDQYPICLMVV